MGEKETSKRQVEGPVPEGRKVQKRKMEVFEVWGHRKETQHRKRNQQPLQMWDWNDTQGSLIVEERRKETETKFTRNVPDGRKDEEGVQAEAREGQEEFSNFPERRKVEEMFQVEWKGKSLHGMLTGRLEMFLRQEGREETSPCKTTCKKEERKVIKERREKK